MKKTPEAKPNWAAVEPEVVVHAVGAGERDRGAVQVVDEEHQGDERHEPHRDFAYRRTLDGRGGLREGLSGHGDSYAPE